ncbi:hypothetical protein F4778DRAFT_775539 [Xylariomycetidae sp. FL2044]|nr:hypothetical protein F4778DRAFT_775539 [Xylariomycetidae sp. FL2044]
MKTFILPLLAYTCGVVAGTSPQPQAVGNWTLHSLAIDCFDANTCDYSFNLYDSALTKHFECNFETKSEDGHTDQVHFENVSCGSVTRQPSDLRVNGAWGSNHSIVLCLTNIAQETWAYFGFDGWELTRTHITDISKVSPAYPVGVFVGPPDGTGAGEFAHPASSAPARYTSESDACIWEVHFMERGIRGASTQIRLDFSDDLAAPYVCSLNATAPAGTDPKHWSFYKLPCDENDWAVSWGYQLEHDGAIMMLHNNNRQASFVWNNVNSRTRLVDSETDPATAYCG